MLNNRMQVESDITRKSRTTAELILLLLLSLAFTCKLAANANWLQPPDTFQRECLEQHNKWRSLHQVEPLTFDPKVSWKSAPMMNGSSHLIDPLRSIA